MNYRVYMREAIKSPIDGTSPREFGKWAILNSEQRKLIGRLLDEMDSADIFIKQQFEEKQDLQNRIDKAYEQLQILHYNFPDYDEIHNRIQDIENILKESGE